MTQDRFGKGFFERYYHAPATRVATARDYRLKAALIAAHAALLEIPIRRVLDAGAGSGMFARACASIFPRASYLGVEVSEWACRRYGWTRGSVVDFTSRSPFDLVICHDVVQYLSPPDTLRALDNLARLARGLVYFSVLTREDWDERCDQSRTDSAVYMRSTRWYRRQLGERFRQLGPGIYLPRSDSRVLFSLDCLD